MPQEPLQGSILKPSAKQISYAPPLDRLAGAVAVSRIHRMGHGRGLAARAAGAAGAAGAAAAGAGGAGGAGGGGDGGGGGAGKNHYKEAF